MGDYEEITDGFGRVIRRVQAVGRDPADCPSDLERLHQAANQFLLNKARQVKADLELRDARNKLESARYWEKEARSSVRDREQAVAVSIKCRPWYLIGLNLGLCVAGFLLSWMLLGALAWWWLSLIIPVGAVWAFFVGSLPGSKVARAVAATLGVPVPDDESGDRDV